MKILVAVKRAITTTSKQGRKRRNGRGTFEREDVNKSFDEIAVEEAVKFKKQA